MPSRWVSIWPLWILEPCRSTMTSRRRPRQCARRRSWRAPTARPWSAWSPTPRSSPDRLWKRSPRPWCRSTTCPWQFPDGCAPPRGGRSPCTPSSRARAPSTPPSSKPSRARATPLAASTQPLRPARSSAPSGFPPSPLGWARVVPGPSPELVASWTGLRSTSVGCRWGTWASLLSGVPSVRSGCGAQFMGPAMSSHSSTWARSLSAPQTHRSSCARPASGCRTPMRSWRWPTWTRRGR
mmetsp:Transcript_14156/g.32094  ORF Transcript_14156/g.32094 Transcript_14156/m.32094 type:complete len:239 (-) Transcript_14156:127-843(-)